MSELPERITNYLLSGGMFNPEMAIHDRVRDLLMDCRKEIQHLQEQLDQYKWRRVEDELPDLDVVREYIRDFRRLGDQSIWDCACQGPAGNCPCIKRENAVRAFLGESPIPPLPDRRKDERG